MLQVNVQSEVARLNAALPDTTIAYIAGLFDGEGCVYIARQLPSAKRPDLVVKTEEADIALAFAVLPRTRGSRRTPAEVTSKRDEFYVALRRAKPSNLFREISALAMLNDQQEE